MYKNHERRATATEEKLRQQTSGKMQLTLEPTSESEDERSSRSSAGQSGRSGYRNLLSPVKVVKTPHNIPPRKFSNQFDVEDNEAKIQQYSYAYDFSDFQKHRLAYVPKVPTTFQESDSVPISLTRSDYPMADGLDHIFPTLIEQKMQYFELKSDKENGSLAKSDTAMNIGVVLSGGQAAGGHNVIMGIYKMAKMLHPDSKVWGFLSGPHGIYTGNYMEITGEYMDLYNNMGGFDMIRAGRHKIETESQFEGSLKTATTLNLDGMVVIGGDDSNTNACLLAEYFAKNKSKCSVVGVPKTIDGDLQNEHIQVSFGFDTATKVYSEAVGNLCTDAVSSKHYYYFVRLMGRSASHIALECALQTRVNLVIVGEEVAKKGQSLMDITMQVADCICKRSDQGKNYGVILVPEGLIEFIPEVKILIGEVNDILSKPFTGEPLDHVLPALSEGSRSVFNQLPTSVSNQLLLDRDPHGNVQVSKIDTERLLILLVMKELANRKRSQCYSGKFTPQSHFFGYEGRCALPSNFDSDYCYALGMNAGYLVHKKCSGYMSCIKNLQDPDPAKWVAAGCPLPAMMGVERRHGEDKAVITKALVKLDGPMFTCYEAVRRKWAILDCYQSPGPIQFQGAGSTAVNFMVKAPDIDAFVYETNIQERFESRHGSGDVLFRQESGLSALSRARIRAPVAIPTAFTKGDFRLTASKRYTPQNQLVQMKIGDQHPNSDANEKSTHFVEIQESLVADQGKDHYLGEVIGRLNHEFAEASSQQGNRYSAASLKQTIAVMLLGAPAPGGNNIVDGLLQYQACRRGTTLVGYWNGVGGLRDDALVNITEESFAPYRNLGGYDYLGRSSERLAADLYGRAAESCRKHGITGLILVGATHALTDAAGLAEEFLRRKVTTGVVALPATLDGNIRHQFFQCSLGFDTAAKVYSQLIGNMLTDSASAIKYWYFIRLMGKDPSHLALECALKTHPNMVLISEECAFRGETLPDVVSRICDLVAERAAQGKNFGSVLIPEGLLSHISAFKHLMAELNALFSNCKTPEEKHALPSKLYKDDGFSKEALSPWSYSLYATLPDFLRLQLVSEQEMSAEVNLSQLETEKLLAYYVAEELKKRKAKGTYSGNFAPVTHFFGYQGRAAHPSLFDCSLASTMGFGAAALLEGGLTGIAVTVKELTLPPAQWRVGGVPLLALLSSQPKTGYRRHELVVPSQEVSLSDQPYQILKAHERAWKFVDHYANPGPVQYLDEGASSVSDTVVALYDVETEIAEEIKGLCAAVRNDTMFAEHPHLLVAALSALRAAKGVLRSMTEQQTLGQARAGAARHDGDGDIHAWN